MQRRRALRLGPAPIAPPEHSFNPKRYAKDYWNDDACHGFERLVIDNVVAQDHETKLENSEGYQPEDGGDEYRTEKVRCALHEVDD